MNNPYSLKCLGAPALFGPSGSQIRFRTRKHLALLIYLTVEPYRPHQRDHLGELLWPRAGTAEARHSLATALSVIRARIGPEGLNATRDQVTLKSGRVRTDID